MLINLLTPPLGDAPDVTTAASFATPGGGRLFIGVIAEEERLKKWMQDPMYEVWRTGQAKASMRMHLYCCDAFDQFKEICTSLALETLGILQVASQESHTTIQLAGDQNPRILTMRMRPLAERLGVDIAVTALPPQPHLAEPGMLFMDMDSTLITCECIDEIADFLGIREEVAIITQRAMEGELDFTTSLTERVKLLAGLDAGVLDRVYDERIELNNGAEKLIETVRAHGWKVGLVSGGFSHFTDKLKTRLNLDYTQSNMLEIRDGRLTGEVLGDVVDAISKREALLAQADAWDIPMEQTVAIGDGANDLPMLEAAGLGIAFHAKTKVWELAPCAISRGGLDRTLDLLT
ncbi:MAG: phosphoserine phosphatase SerB [Mariprofundaceae bacterium]